MTFDDVISRFENPQRNGRGVKVRCPSHADKKNSLSISQADNGKILLKCQAGCDTKTVIEAVKLDWRDLSNGNSSQSNNDPIIARYIYVDEGQKPLYRACRTRSKNFFQERFDAASGRFIPGMNGTRRVLYRLPEILKSETVYIAEGEKDAEKLITFALTATTNIGGAGKWDQSYSEALKDKHVVIFPDNDDPGQEHGLLVARSVLPLAKSVKLISLPDLPQKGDVSDYLSSHSKEDLLALVEAAAPFTGALDGKGQASLWPEFLTAREILQAPKDPTRWVVADCLPVGSASVLVAKPKVGKRATGRLKIEGTLIEVEVQEAEPKILELIEEEGGEMTEKQIGQSIPIRALIISKTLRKLYRDGKVERTGKGRRNSPFLYSIAGSVLDQTVTPDMHSHVTTSYSLPLKGGDNSGREKRETETIPQHSESKKKILFPDNREPSGKRMEENQNQGVSGRETDPWESERVG